MLKVGIRRQAEITTSGVAMGRNGHASMRGGKSSGPVQRILVGGSRTSPSPSASVDLAHLRPRPRSWFVHSRHTSPEPEAEGEFLPRGRHYSSGCRRDRDAQPSIRDRRSLGRRQESGIQGTPPFNVPTVGDGAAVGLRYGVVLWSSRPPAAPPVSSLSDVVRPGSCV